MNVAIVLAGGTGSRVGADRPKQFIEVLGKPILAYTLENFQNDREIDAIELVYHKDWLDEIRTIVDDYKFNKVKWLTTGGNTFQESALNGVSNLRKVLDKEDIVVISFGVSPFTTEDIINDSIRVCKLHGNAVSAEDSPLCTCIKDDEYCSSTNLLRETIKGFSNPWTFKFGELCKAYDEVIKRGIFDEIEPHTTSVYFALGKKIWFSKSSGHNFKITTQDDLEQFEGLLLLKERREEESKRKAGLS